MLCKFKIISMIKSHRNVTLASHVYKHFWSLKGQKCMSTLPLPQPRPHTYTKTVTYNKYKNSSKRMQEILTLSWVCVSYSTCWNNHGSGERDHCLPVEDNMESEVSSNQVLRPSMYFQGASGLECVWIDAFPGRNWCRFLWEVPLVEV